MKQQLESLFQKIVNELGQDLPVQFTQSDISTHGDYTTTVALQLAKSLKKNPLEIATDIKEKFETAIKSNKETSFFPGIEKIEVQPPGFLNVFFTASELSSNVEKVLKNKELFGSASAEAATFSEVATKAESADKHVNRKKIMVEFAHPNTHKAFHIGHLRNITTGESLVRLLETVGHTVIRANYQGDVGMHIAKCLYGFLHLPASETGNIEKLDLHKKVELLGKAYAAGSKAFDENESAKQEIKEINKKIYTKDAAIWELYQQTRQWSLEYFDSIYKRVGSHFDRFYFEGEAFELGKKIVLGHIADGIFTKSDGAIIFEGAEYGLHNRVFISGEGNPTYEGKDIGLANLQFKEYHPDLIIHLVGPEQAGYFQVLFKALEQVMPESKGKEIHLIYGWVKLKHGKMSSRSGNVVLGEWLLDEAKKEIYNILQKNKSNYTKEAQEVIAEKAAVAAVKYSFLKVSTKQEIAFDLASSVSFEGDSGPYLQYTYSRARSVMQKANKNIEMGHLVSETTTVNADEREVMRLLLYFPGVVLQAASQYAPNLLCSYLFQLAQAFNAFYAKHSILGSKDRESQAKLENKELRLALTAATAQVIKNGLYLLGIEVVERM